MDTYFARLEEIVKRHEEEVNHLNSERDSLRNEKNNMPLESFNREYQRINFYLDNENKALEEARNTLQSYRYNYDKAYNLINDLRTLREELRNSRDDQDEKAINEEITSKEQELQDAIKALPQELADILRNSILNGNENTNNTLEEKIPVANISEENQEQEQLNLSPAAKEDYDRVSLEIEKLKELQKENNQALKESIDKIRAIIEEQRNKYEKEGPFDNETLNNLQEYYMGLKMSEEKIFIAAKRREATLKRRLKQLENKQKQIFEIDNIALTFDISYNESKELFSTLKNRKIINKILEQKGLGDIIHKKSRTKIEKEQLKNALEEIRKEIIAYHKEKNVNIKESINALYGIEDKVIGGKERKIKLPEETHLRIIDNAKKLPAVIRKETHKEKDIKKDSEDIALLPNKSNNTNLLPDNLSNKVEKEDKEEKDIPKNEEDISLKTEDNKLKRGLREIIGSLRKDLYIGKKDGQRYRRSNLKINQNFQRELHSGNTLYNIVHVVPAVVKAGSQLLAKISGKIMLGKDAKEMIQTLETRVDNLHQEDLETIFTEYRGNRINQERYPQALNMVIESKMSEYILGKVTTLNNNIEKEYKNIFYYQQLLKALDENMRKGKVSSEEKIAKLQERKDILNKCANSIKYIRTSKVEADNLLSGGLHGLSEDMKAAATKLNCVGMRFSKNYDLDQDLENALMNCEIRENRAIHENNNEELLKAFIESETLLSKNTEIKSSIFGNRSIGKKYYSPLSEQLDYRNDPFIRDLFTSIAFTTAAISAVDAIKVHTKEGGEFFNNSEDSLLNQVHKAGEEITSKKGAMYEGMRAQAREDVLSSAGSIERASLDKNGWVIGSDAYHAADHAGHEFYNNLYNSIEERFANVSHAYGSGAIDRNGVLQELSSISSDAHATLVNVADKCLEILKPYAQTNPQFDLSAVQESMEFLVNHPNAISNMNQAMVDVQNIGENLISLSEKQLSSISSLPGDLAPTLLAAASASALATKVSTEMHNQAKKKYGNSVTDMVNEYIEKEENETISRNL